ncbi:MAG: hypothetical protein MJY87_05130 [Fibrobacter sp.]|nr:hypothetical protein [Fibrobacter sp.]
MDIAIKLMLVSSVVLIGYSLSHFFSSYEAVCKKVEEFRQLAAENSSEDIQIKRSNTILISLLSSAFLVVAYFAGFDYWVLGLICGKFLITGALSNMELNLILKKNAVDRKFFWISKVDSVFNCLLGVATSLILVL